MIISIVVIFVIAYAAIAFEHPLKLNKTVPALFGGILMWAIIALNSDSHWANHELSHFISHISEILFFLLGAMTIVELIDAHQGFKIITNRITTRSPRALLIILSITTFFFSAVLDNLTTTIVMISLLRKLVHNKEQRMAFIGMVIIAANAGGAWSPMGDVTTTMLWIGGQISFVSIVQSLILPSLVCLFVPLIVMWYRMDDNPVERAEYDTEQALKVEKIKGSLRMLVVGVGALFFVPVFKTLTHLPPYMGMLLGLSVVWAVSEFLHIDKSEEEKKPYSAIHALEKIDTASVLFFLGILVAVSALQVTGVLESTALFMSEKIGNMDAIIGIIGLLSSIVDNVPIVAGAMGMYPLANEMVNPEAFQFAIANPNLVQDGAFLFNEKMYYLQDAKMWQFLAYCAGTGGSSLIIGSAAGVAAMGMENISFGWYVKKISFLALIGYIAGALFFLAMYAL